MKTGFRSFVAGLFLATVSSVFGAVDNRNVATTLAPQPAISEAKTTVVTAKTTLSPAELARYQHLQQQADEKTRDQAAGEGMDKSTMIIIGVLVVVVIVAVAAGGGGGSHGY